MKQKYSLEERFWPKVRKSDTCWNWIASRTKLGYGQIYFKENGVRRVLKASRVSWEIHHGPVQNNLHVCHTCDNPACVNPDHLFLGTPLDNALDKVAKGRARGPSVGCGIQNNKKLSQEQVSAIRAAIGSQKSIASRFGINQSQVSRIRNGKRWSIEAHLE
jgi:hypothetical protein